MQGVQFGPDPIGRIRRALFVRDDQQVVLGDDVKGQAHLVQKQLQTGFESDPIEAELNGILGLDGLPVERGHVEDNGRLERLLEVRIDLVQRSRTGKGETVGPKKCVLKRSAARGTLRLELSCLTVLGDDRIDPNLGPSVDVPRVERLAFGGAVAPRSWASSAYRPEMIRPATRPIASRSQ